jgi:hypothetical protein
MKKVIIILAAFLFGAIQAKATHCCDRIYQEEKINLFLCQNCSSFSETRALLFKARTKVLNDYIKDKIAKGELENKKFEIIISDELLSSLYLELTQGRNGYFVILSGSPFPSLQELKAFVDYFAKPDWKPFIAGFSYQKENETQEEFEKRNNTNEQRISDFYKQNISTDSIHYQPFSIWEKDGVALHYSGDRLKYVINNTTLLFQTNATLPVKINDRYLFFHHDSIFVFQDMQTINTLTVEEPYCYDSSDFDVYVFPKWVNISWGGIDNLIYSYSYDKNKFYKLTVNH